MEKAYPNLLSPVKIGNVTLKNRMLSSKCCAKFTDFETDTAFYCNIAKNGAASVVVNPGGYPDRALEYLPDGRPSHMLDGADLTIPENREKFSQMCDAIHKYDTKVAVSMMCIEPCYVGIADNPDFDKIPATGDYSQILFNKPGATTAQLEAIGDEFAWRCRDMQELGVDMCTIYMSYRASILALSLSPLYNLRTDKYGGKTVEERATLSLEVFRKIKKACGKDFLIELQISGEEEAPGYTMEDWLTYCKLCEGLVDIIQVRGFDGSETHVSGHNMKPHCPPQLRFAEAFKQRGIDILVSPIGGFGDPDDMERWLREGKADLFSMARRFLADSDFGRKVAEGRAADITPCMLCNECHGPSPSCSVNPRIANTKQYPAPERQKNVAIIGGGPAGMQAALTAAERGHTVTLFEASDALGGQLKAAGVPEFKWPLRAYCAFMVKKTMEDPRITVHLNTKATPELLRGYDAILWAAGSAPKNVPVPGADSEGVWMAEDVLGREDELGHRVVVIGGATTGRETALHLAQHGHEVVMVTRAQAKLFHDNHAQRIEEEVFLNTPGLSYIEHAKTLEIRPGSVKLEVKTGIPKQIQGFKAMGVAGMGYYMTPDVPASLMPENSSLQLTPEGIRPAPYDESHAVTHECTIECDTVVISGGRAPRTEAAEAFRSLAPEFCILGDAERVGDIKSATASGYAAAMAL